MTVERRLGLLAAGGALVSVVAMAWALRHTYSGDSAIYLPFAHNIANGDPFSFNPHHFSSGSTSALWPFLLAPAHALGTGADGSKAIAALLTAGALGSVTVAAARTTGLLLASALATWVILPGLGLTGALLYETPLTIGLVSLSVLLGAQLAASERRDARALAPLVLVWAALPLARPEAAALVPLQALVLWRAGGGGWRHLRPLALAVAVAAIPALVYFGYSEAVTGSFSTSAEARSRGLRETATRVGPLYVSSDGIDYITSTPFVFAFVPGLAGLVLLARSRANRWVGAYGLGAIAIYLCYVSFVAPGSFLTGKYLLPAIPFVTIGLAYTVRALRRRELRLAALAFVFVFVALPGARDAVRETHDQPGALDGGAARIVNRRASPGDTVLTHEVQVRYLLRDDLSVLSLDGVTDGKVFPYIAHRRVDAFLRRYRPRFWIATSPIFITAVPYLDGSALRTAALRFKADPGLRELVVDGIRFRLVAHRAVAPIRVFGGWTWVFELSYL
jgi:hypothetical protein